MYSYLGDLFWTINKLLLIVTIILAIGVIIYAAARNALHVRRTRALALTRVRVRKSLRTGKGVTKEIRPGLSGAFLLLNIKDILKTGALTLPEETTRCLKELLADPRSVKEIEAIARSSGDKWHRIEAIAMLGYLKTQATLGILRDSLYDKDEDVSYFAMLALGRIKTVGSAHILLDFIGEGVYSGHKIVSVLEKFPPTVTGEAVRATESNNAAVRFWAVKLLSSFQATGYLKRIQELTKDESPDVRAAACEFIGELGNRETTSAFVACLNDKVWFVRMHAVRALSKLLGEAAIPSVIHLFLDDSMLVRESVKTAIIPHIKSALPSIERFLFSDDRVAKRDCIDVLVASGHVATLMQDLLSTDLELKNKALVMLDAMVKSGVYFGFKRALENFSIDDQKKICELLDVCSWALDTDDMRYG